MPRLTAMRKPCRASPRPQLPQNDLANNFGSSVGTKALRMYQVRGTGESIHKDVTQQQQTTGPAP